VHCTSGPSQPFKGSKNLAAIQTHNVDAFLAEGAHDDVGGEEWHENHLMAEVLLSLLLSAYPSQWVKSVLEGLKHHQPEDDRYPDATDYAER
jgi:hypothetical protein